MGTTMLELTEAEEIYLWLRLEEVARVALVDGHALHPLLDSIHAKLSRSVLPGFDEKFRRVAEKVGTTEAVQEVERIIVMPGEFP